MESQEPPSGLSRRDFVHVLGAGLLITVTGEIALAQRRGGRGGGGGFGGRGPANVAARLHIDRDGSVTVMTGKVEAGQGSRAEITQAAAEELRLDPARIRLIMADTALAPDDGMTAGSRSTPATVPSVRSGAAAARELLLGPGLPTLEGRSRRRCGSATAPSCMRPRTARSVMPNWPKRKTLPRRSPGRSPATSP